MASRKRPWTRPRHESASAADRLSAGAACAVLGVHGGVVPHAAGAVHRAGNTAGDEPGRRLPSDAARAGAARLYAALPRSAARPELRGAPANERRRGTGAIGCAIQYHAGSAVSRALAVGRATGFPRPF